MTSKYLKLIYIPLIIGVLIIILIAFKHVGFKNQITTKQSDSLKQATTKSFEWVNNKIVTKYIKAASLLGDTIILTRFKNEIENFKKEDSINPNRNIDVVFAGSSSIRKWACLQKDMKELNVLNRGFGGSTIPEVIYYSDILVFRHNPKKIVFYAGENDIATPNTDSLIVFDSFVYFQKMVERKLPKTRIFFISIKLSPIRSIYWNKIKATNKMIQQYCNSTLNCTFIDVNKHMLDKNGKVRKDLFVKDQLHLNTEGYKIWTGIIYDAIKTQSK